MKVLLHGINFAPELTGVGKYTGEMAAWLASRGHEVRVVTAPPHYPRWEVDAGHSARHYRSHDWMGVRVLRCPLWLPRRMSGVKRLVHLLSFAVSSATPMLWQLRWKPDVVWVVEPPLFCAPLALLVGRLSGAKTILHVQDLEVDAAFEMGLLRGRRLRAMVARLESALLRRFDCVSTISGRMLERLRDKGVPPQRLHLCPNWADVVEPAAAGGGSSYRALLAIPEGATVALYSGNMGRKQGLELLAQVAAALSSTPDIYFVFCGNGVGRDDLQAQCRGLDNVRFIDLQPADKLAELLASADIHLLPQRADASDLVMPSKLTGMLASGRPVVATAVAGSELDAVVRPCGIVVTPGDASAAARAVLELARDPERAGRLGRRGVEYARRHLSRDVILDRYVARFEAA